MFLIFVFFERKTNPLCILSTLYDNDIFHHTSVSHSSRKMATGSGALFGNTSSRTSSKNLVEFRAGKMFMKEKMVHPDKRKGLVYVYQSDDSLMHFCWKDRTSGSVEDVRKQLNHR